MRLWALQAPLHLAEHLRRRLLSAGLINYEARMRKRESFILIPLRRHIDIKDLEDVNGFLTKNTVSIIQTEFESSSPKPSLEDLLGFSPSFDVIGDIAVIDADDPEAERIAHALLDYRKSINVVLGSTGPVSGEFRTRNFVVLAGENRTHTIHTEYGCRYKVDLEQAYFSPRLGTERKRVADTVKSKQVVVDLFAGVGPFSILIGKKVPESSVVAVDINPAAVQLLRENIRLNRTSNVTAVEADARHAARTLNHSADHVIMNLPHSSREFLDCGILVAKNGAVVHFYDITHEDDLYNTSWGCIRKAAAQQGKKAICINKRMVRSYAPYHYTVYIGFQVNRENE